MKSKKSQREYSAKRAFVFIFALIIILSIYFFKDAYSVWLRVSTAIVFLIFFYVADHLFDIRFEPRHYVYIALIAIFSLLLSDFYYSFPNYDKVQHFIQPMLMCSIIFYMVSKLHLALKWQITFTFFITLGILGIFEVGEYALDYVFDLKLQGVYLRDIQGLEKFHLITDRIDDTMIDLIIGMLGTSLYCFVFGWWMRRRISHLL